MAALIVLAIFPSFDRRCLGFVRGECRVILEVVVVEYINEMDLYEIVEDIGGMSLCYGIFVWRCVGLFGTSSMMDMIEKKYEYYVVD